MITNSTVNVREHRFAHIPHQTKNKDFEVKLELVLTPPKAEQPHHTYQLWNTFKYKPVGLD